MTADDSTVENGGRDTNGMSETEMLELMEAALLALPRVTREIFLAHRLDDLSYGDIATITGVSTRRIERETGNERDLAYRCQLRIRMIPACGSHGRRPMKCPAVLP